MTTSILTIITVFSAMAVIVLALMQQSKSDMGSAFGGGGSQSMFGSRGSANFLSRLTAVMCTAFFVSSLALAYVHAKRSQANSVVAEPSVLEQVQEGASQEIPVIPSADETPDIPVIESESEVPNIQEAATDAVEQVEQAVEAATEPESN